MMIGLWDWTILSSAAVAFVIFFALQMIIFRMFHQEAVLKAIMIIFIMTSIFFVVTFALLLTKVGNLSFLGAVLTVGLSYFLFGLVAFVYILCVFGPSETSIRIRLVRELSESDGHTMGRMDLLANYNAKMVLERRLERLTRSGEIVFQNGKYRLVKKTNAFFLIDSIANAIHGFIKTK